MTININAIGEPLFQRAQTTLARSTTVRMWLINLCALIAILQSSVSDSYSSLLVALSAIIAALLTEFLILRESGRAKKIKDGSAVATALILTLLLPNRISPIYAAAGAVFALMVIKHSFGGLGSNWLNPAAGGWLFVRLCWPASFKAALEGSPLSHPVDAVAFFSESTPVTDTFRLFLNNTVFSFIDVELPAGYLEFFTLRAPGIIADRGVLALLLGTIIISATQITRFWIPAAFLVVFGVLVRIAGALPFGGDVGDGDVLLALFSGGTLVAAFFLAAEPATGAKSTYGILLSTTLAGGIAFMFRYLGSEPYGAVFAVLLINAILPLVRIVETNKLYIKQGIC